MLSTTILDYDFTELDNLLNDWHFDFDVWPDFDGCDLAADETELERRLKLARAIIGI